MTSALIPRTKKLWSDHRLLFVILALTAVLYSRSIGNGFVNLDDPMLVTQNPNVTHASWQSVKNVFTSYDPELYIPLTLVSYQAEAWTLGMDSWHFHLINLLLHLLCTSLVYSVALRLTKKKTIAILTALLFAVHPINSEAVLWISARKDLLSAFFFLLSWRMYLSALKGSTLFYCLSLAAFALALLSKVSAITLPFVLLLSLWHLKQPINGTRRKQMSQFFALSILFGIIALLGKPYVTQGEHLLTLLTMAVRSTVFYLQLMAVPTGQAAVHPLSAEFPFVSSLMLLLSILLLAMISRLAWLKRTSMPILATGWLLSLITLAPTWLHSTRGGEDIIIGSERYAYLPSIGIFVMAASAGVWLYEHRAVRKQTRLILSVALACLLLLYCLLTWQRTAVFRNSVTFNDDILNKAPLSAMAHYNLALALEEAREPQNADDEYAEAMALRPDFADAAINRGILYMREERTSEALTMFEKSIRMRPDYYKGHFNLGVANQKLEQWDAAIAAYRKTVELFPDFPEVHRNLATVYGKKKMFREALAEYEILAELDPEFRGQFLRLQTTRE